MMWQSDEKNEKTAKTQVMEWTGERMVPEMTPAGTFWEHIYRYRFAIRHTPGKDVLDIACGEGYGSAALLKGGAKSVIGVDISKAACEHAQQKYGVDARCGSAEAIPLPAQSVDVVVSFETVEHVQDPRKFLEECRRVLRPGGRLIISTPNKELHDEKGHVNQFHCSEVNETEFLKMLGDKFRVLRFYSQSIDYAAWWSLRSLSTPHPGTRWIRGYYRLRSFVQEPDWGVVPDRFREDPVGAILSKESFFVSLLNPYGIWRRAPSTKEIANYYIALAEPIL